MQSGLWRYTVILAASIAMATLGSCKARDTGDQTSGTGSPTPGDPGAAAAMRSDTAGAPAGAAGELSDANIVALLDEANQSDSAAGAYAVGKATNPEVKAFARLMMGEHHTLRVQGDELAKRLNITPRPPPNDPVQAMAQSEMAALRAAPKGAQFDRVYIDQEVAVHKAVLDLADQAHEAAQSDELKALIEKAKPVIEKHRDQAEEIQKKLGKPSV